MRWQEIFLRWCHSILKYFNIDVNFFILKRKIGAAAFFSSSKLCPCREQPNKKLLRICFPLLPRMEWIKLKFDWSGSNKHFYLTKIVSKQTNFWGKISNRGHTLFFKTDSSTFFMQDHIGLDKPNGLIQWLSAESIIIQLPFLTLPQVMDTYHWKYARSNFFFNVRFLMYVVGGKNKHQKQTS